MKINTKGPPGPRPKPKPRPKERNGTSEELELLDDEIVRVLSINPNQEGLRSGDFIKEIQKVPLLRSMKRKISGKPQVTELQIKAMIISLENMKKMETKKFFLFHMFENRGVEVVKDE